MTGLGRGVVIWLTTIAVAGEAREIVTRLLVDHVSKLFLNDVANKPTGQMHH
jgi:hypothetical protein